MTVVLKLGGSVITEKDDRETLDGPALDAAADAVAAAHEGLALVHGAGSFGHHHADAHGATVTSGVTDAGAVLDIHGAMTTLNRFVLARLHARDVPALPVHPLSVGARDAAGDLSLPLDAATTMHAEGFVPVLHGDGVAPAGEGVTILPGDEVVVRLARALAAHRVGLCSPLPRSGLGQRVPSPHPRDGLVADPFRSGRAAAAADRCGFPPPVVPRLDRGFERLCAALFAVQQDADVPPEAAREPLHVLIPGGGDKEPPARAAGTGSLATGRGLHPVCRRPNRVASPPTTRSETASGCCVSRPTAGRPRSHRTSRGTPC